jgi:hypothetical protein
VVSHDVGYDEMEGLVRHHKRCSARKLLNLFCVGMDLLWSCPETSNITRLRWVTVMYWDAAKIRYKILFRNGHDAWVTGEALDQAIALKATYSDRVQVQASIEKWDVSAVQATLLTFGLYCAKHVGPQVSAEHTATASINGQELYPQRFSLGQQSALTKDKIGTAALGMTSTTEVASLPLTSGMHPLASEVRQRPMLLHTEKKKKEMTILMERLMENSLVSSTRKRTMLLCLLTSPRQPW